jgi:TonB family protein
VNRLQRKCIVASVIVHGLLALTLLIGPAFSKKRVEPQPAFIELITPATRVTDAPTRGASAPVVPPTKPPPAAESKPVVAVKPPEPAPVTPRVVPKPVGRTHPEEIVKDADLPAPKKTKPVKPDAKTERNKIDLDKPVVRDTKRKQQQKEEADRQAEDQAARDHQRQLAKAIGNITSDIKSNSSSATSVEIPNGKGEAFVNYGQLVKELYDRAWIDPQDVADDNASVRVKIVVGRDGSVTLARIEQRSGVPALDKSVQRALDRVTRVAPFPEGSRDEERTFFINFNLKSKRSTG